VLAKYKQFQILIRNPPFIITIIIHGKKIADTKGIINQTLYIKEGQTIQWLKETREKDHQWTTKKSKQEQKTPQI
jgi:DNA polymerase III delta subunit